MINIFNIRDGFANNSSSTHSIIFADAPPSAKSSYDTDFGWDYFTVADKTGVLDYIRATLCSNMKYDMNSEYIRCVVDNWIGEPYNYDDSNRWSEFPSVDHQSCVMLPMVFDESALDKRFFLEFKNLLLENNTLILGGNDNDEELHSLHDTKGTATSFLTDRSSMICKKSGEDYWTLFDRQYGTKYRLTFTKNGQEFIKPTKAWSPDLVDVKITDFCTFGCDFCLIPNTLISETDLGTKYIEDIEIGYTVKSYDIENESIVENDVDQLFSRMYDGDIIDIELDNGTILSITPYHEIFTLNRGWINAGELTIDDEVLYIKL